MTIDTQNIAKVVSYPIQLFTCELHFENERDDDSILLVLVLVCKLLYPSTEYNIYYAST
jgi:hypothetical protein